MSTNFYLRRVPTEKDIKDIHDAVDRLDFDDAGALMMEASKKIHIGKRSCGWQFLFDIHRNSEWGDSADGMEISKEEFCLDKVKTYIDEKIGDGWILKDEYGEEFTPEQFWSEEVGDSLYMDERHNNHKSYYEKHPEESRYIRVDNFEFESEDGLRCCLQYFC